jgi:anti-sigma regulatory factor (Ser/Thr protein kinase)
MNAPEPGSLLTPDLRWRRVFPGHERELSALRRWLSALLPECPARDDVLIVANELSTNAIRHTASGRGSWFAVEVTRYQSVVQVAVADCGGAAEPHVIEDREGEHGRGLLLVRDLSVRTGVVGDQRGRLVWAQCAWADQGPAAPAPSQDPYQGAIRDGEAALARRFTGVPAWFGRSTLRWWAVAGEGLVSAPSARELAGLLYRLLDAPRPRAQGKQAHSSRALVTGDVQYGAAGTRLLGEGPGPGADGWDGDRRTRLPPRADGAGTRRQGPADNWRHGCSAAREPVPPPGLRAAGAASPRVA